MEKIDVAVQNYNKKESLMYTLLTLKKYCGQHIENIYINDDCSSDESEVFFKNPYILRALQPWNIYFRVNEKKAGLCFYTAKMLRKPHNLFNYITDVVRGCRPTIVQRDDVRYQYALDKTNKNYLFIIHDDIEFRADVVDIYLKNIQRNMAIIGDLGQCWRCPIKDVCSPEKLISLKRAGGGIS